MGKSLLHFGSLILLLTLAYLIFRGLPRRPGRYRISHDFHNSIALTPQPADVGDSHVDSFHRIRHDHENFGLDRLVAESPGVHGNAAAASSPLFHGAEVKRFGR